MLHFRETGIVSEEHPVDVTRILSAIGRGEPEATDALLPIVYEELRGLARARMLGEPADHTLQPTALVHEAYLRLVQTPEADWENRRHFFAAAAQAMRRILVERARRVAGPKRGGGRARMPLDEVDCAIDPATMSFLALDESLEALEAKDPQMAEVVKLRYFAGLSVEETAQALGLSPRTVKREWSVARAWLYERMGGQRNGQEHD